MSWMRYVGDIKYWVLLMWLISRGLVKSSTLGEPIAAQGDWELKENQVLSFRSATTESSNSAQKTEMREYTLC